MKLTPLIKLWRCLGYVMERNLENIFKTFGKHCVYILKKNVSVLQGGHLPMLDVGALCQTGKRKTLPKLKNSRLKI